jgi:hypothetical protein
MVDDKSQKSAQILGAGGNVNISAEVWKGLGFGPEQVAQYNLEFSQVSAKVLVWWNYLGRQLLSFFLQGLSGCCPHGFCEERITYCYDIDDLLEMEAEAADLVKEACLELSAAGENAKKRQRKSSRLELNDLFVKFSDKVEQKYETEMQLIQKSHDKRHAASSSIPKIQSREINGDQNKPSVRFNLNPTCSDSSFVTATSQTEAPERSRGFDSGLMRRASARLVPTGRTEPEPWELVEKIASESKDLNRRVATKYRVDNGRWSMPTFGGLRRKICSLLMWTHDNSSDITDVMARDSTYAVGKFYFWLIVCLDASTGLVRSLCWPLLFWQ